MSKLFVKVHGPYLVQHEDNRLELVDPGSVVELSEDDARQYLNYGLGELVDGPAKYVRLGLEAAARVERPGLDARQAKAERAVAIPQLKGT